jgi:hypothetical protein
MLLKSLQIMRLVQAAESVLFSSLQPAYTSMDIYIAVEFIL